MSEVTLARRGARADVVLDRPAALNAITPAMLAELDAALADVARDGAVRVVVLTGAGRAFSAGVDLKALGEVEVRDGAVGGALDEPARSVIARIERMPKPVIARVNGACFTGALEIALACDLLIAAAEAKLGDTHVRWGLRPSWGMSQRLPRRVGAQRARELSFTARTFTGAEAAAMGLALAAPPLAELDAAVDRLCEAILAQSAQAVAAYKDLYRVTDGMGLDDGLAYEAGTSYRIGDTAERLAEFLER